MHLLFEGGFLPESVSAPDHGRPGARQRRPADRSARPTAGRAARYGAGTIRIQGRGSSHPSG